MFQFESTESDQKDAFVDWYKQMPNEYNDCASKEIYNIVSCDESHINRVFELASIEF